MFDLEPRAVESDYELAFRTIGSKKRALVLVFTDLLEEIFGDRLPLIGVAAEIFGGVDGEDAIFIDGCDALLKREEGELGGIGSWS